MIAAANVAITALPVIRRTAIPKRGMEISPQTKGMSCSEISGSSISRRTTHRALRNPSGPGAGMSSRSTGEETLVRTATQTSSYQSVAGFRPPPLAQMAASINARYASGGNRRPGNVGSSMPGCRAPGSSGPGFRSATSSRVPGASC